MIDGNGNRAELRYDGHGRQDRWTFPSATRPAALTTPPRRPRWPPPARSTPTIMRNMATTPPATARACASATARSIAFAYDALNRVTAEDLPAAAGAAATRASITATTSAACRLYARFDRRTGEGVTNAYDGFGRLASSSTNMGGDDPHARLPYDPPATGPGSPIRTAPSFDYDYDAARAGLTASARARQRRSAQLSLFRTATLRRVGRPRRHGDRPGYATTALRRLSLADRTTSPAPPTTLLDFAHNPAGQIATRHPRPTTPMPGPAIMRSTAPTRPTGSTSTATAGARRRSPTTPTATSTSDGTTHLRLRHREPAGRRPPARTSTLDLRPARPAVPGRAAPSGTTRFLYDGDALVAEYNGSGTAAARYVHGAGADDARWSGTKAPASPPPPLPLRRPPGLDRRHRRRLPATASRSTLRRIRHPRRGQPGPVPVYRPDLARPSSACITTRPGSTRRRWGGSCRPIRSGMTIRSISMPMSGTIRSMTEPTEACSETDRPAPDQLTHSVEHANIPPERALASVELQRNALGRVAGVIGQLRGGRGRQPIPGRIERAGRSERAPASGRPRPGSRGAADHQADVRGPGLQQAERQARPGERVADREPVVGHPGLNRRPDNQIVGTDGRTRLAVESERRPNGTYHRTREADYHRCGITCQTRNLPRSGDQGAGCQLYPCCRGRRPRPIRRLRCRTDHPGWRAHFRSWPDYHRKNAIFR